MPPHPDLEVRGDLGPWRPAWDVLALRAPLPSPFQRSWWLESVAGPATRFVLVHEGERLLGGVALEERRGPAGRRYGAPGPAVLCPDHLDALAEPGAERAVVEALSRWFASPGARRLDVRGIVEGSLLAQAVPGRALPDDVAPYQPLDGAGFLASLSSSRRRSVRRSTHSLQQVGLAHRRAAPEEVPAALAELVRLHRIREDRGPLLAEIDLVSRAVRRGAEVGEARVDVLGAPTQAVAVTVAFEVAGRLSLYQVARSTDPAHDGAGTALLAAVAEDAAAGGCTEVDLLRGDEGYKASFAAERRPLLRLRAAHGWRAAAAQRGEHVARGLIRWARRRRR